MAFTVTPTSGDAPYEFSAIVDNAFYVDGINYKASVRSAVATGSCPALGNLNAFSANQLNSLLAGNIVSYIGVSVGAGDCGVFTLEIRQVDTDTVIASSNVFVDNT